MIEDLQNELQEKSQELRTKQLCFERSEIELHRMTKENLKMSADYKILTDSLKAETELKMEYKKALDDNEIVQ